MRVRCAFLAVPGSTVTLELLEYQNVSRQAVDLQRANPGNAHLALGVTDLDEMYQRLKQAGVEFVSKVVISDAGHYEGTKIVYLLDPDGISVQLMQLPLRAAESPTG